ncbi:hypothetical protein N7488_012272 [Penicillium malachiteum]|nr:hypothetical protein N7488_012272 [Penicillium malachiteum]
MAIYPSLLGTTASRSSVHSNGSGNSLESRHSQQKPVETQNGVKKNRKKSKKTEKKEKSSRKKKGITTEKAETFSDDESQIDLGGSPWDPTERKHLKLEDLDLHKSYVDDYEKAGRTSQEQEKKTERHSSRRKWNYKGQKPLTNIPKLIEMEWDTREPDLDPTPDKLTVHTSRDLQGQIQRCKERIEENIMPSFFEERLKRLEAENNALIAIQRSESQDLSESAIKRIASLRETELGLQEKGNTSQLVNVQAILAAYRSKALDWTAGLVTYWSGGQQLCQPRPFSWDEFEVINDACNRSESFWVEGGQNGIQYES